MRATRVGHDGRMVAIVLIVVVLVLFGAAYGIYSRRGSEISQHPRGGDHAEDPGVGTEPSRASTRGDETEGDFSTHGTK